MFKLIKYIILIAIVAFVVLAATGVKIKGKTVTEHAKVITQNKLYQETLRDVRTLVGEAFKAVGGALSDDVTEEDKKALQNVIKEDLQKDQGQAPAPAPTQVQTPGQPQKQE